MAFSQISPENGMMDLICILVLTHMHTQKHTPPTTHHRHRAYTLHIHTTYARTMCIHTTRTEAPTAITLSPKFRVCTQTPAQVSPWLQYVSHSLEGSVLGACNALLCCLVTSAAANLDMQFWFLFPFIFLFISLQTHTEGMGCVALPCPLCMLWFYRYCPEGVILSHCVSPASTLRPCTAPKRSSVAVPLCHCVHVCPERGVCLL